MKPFTKIINTISSKEKLYTTPFLNFDYSPRTISRNRQRDNSEALGRALKQANESQEGAEKRKAELLSKYSVDELIAIVRAHAFDYKKVESEKKIQNTNS